MSRWNSAVEFCASALGSFYLYFLSMFFGWFLAAGLGMAVAELSFGHTMDFNIFNILFLGFAFIIGPFPGGFWFLFYPLFVILYAVGAMTESRKTRGIVLAINLLLAAISGFRADTLFW